MASTKLATLGIGATNLVVPIAIIEVTSIANYGDGTDTTAANFAFGTANPLRWGWTNGSPNLRKIVLWSYALGAALPGQIQIAKATLKLGITSRTLNTIPASITLNIHEIEGALGAGIDGSNRATATPWYLSGKGPAPGFDYDLNPIGTAVISNTQLSSLPTSNATAVIFFVDLPITDALQRAKDAKKNLDLVAPVTFPNAGTGNFHYINFDNPQQTSPVNMSVLPHTYIEVRYWPALGVLSADETQAGRPPDFTKLHDPVAAGTSNRTYLDAIEQGTVGPTRKLWAWNFRKAGRRRDVIVGTSRSEHTNIDNSAAGGRTLRAVQLYDTGTGLGSDSGDFVLEAQGSTTYKLAYTDPAGTTTYLLEKTTGLTTVTFAANHIFRNVAATKDVCNIETARFSATTGWSAADRVRWSVRGDQRTTQSVDTLSLVEVMPPTTALGDTGNTTRARKLYNAFTQQFWAAPSNVVISAVSRGQVAVRDTLHTGWIVGGKVTIFIAGGSTVIDDLTISAIDPPGYTDTLRFDRDFTGPELAALTAAGHVTGGVYLGDMAAFAVRNLAAAAGPTDNVITLNTSFDGGQPGQVFIADDSTIPTTAKLVTVLSGTTALTLSATLGLSFAQGSNVYLVVDPVVAPASMSGKPYFVQGSIPANEPEGLYSGYELLFEERTVS